MDRARFENPDLEFVRTYSLVDFWAIQGNVRFHNVDRFYKPSGEFQKLKFPVHQQQAIVKKQARVEQFLFF